jgi:hypothetical protein
MHNKENKKGNDTSLNSKFVLKPREFGREITNASSSSEDPSAGVTKKPNESSI